MSDDQLLTLVKQAFMQAGWKAPQATTSPVQAPTAPEVPAPEPTPTPETPAEERPDIIFDGDVAPNTPSAPPEIPVAS